MQSRVAKVPAEKKAMLQNLVAKVGTHLSEAERTEFYNLLLDYSDNFAINDSDIGQTNALRHNIKTVESKPIRQLPRRLPPHQKDKVNYARERYHPTLKQSMGISDSFGSEGWKCTVLCGLQKIECCHHKRCLSFAPH